MRLKDMNRKARNDHLASLSENAVSGLIELSGRFPLTAEEREGNFRYFCRMKGTRIARIMDMIEAGKTDAEIGTRYKMDAATAQVYRKAYENRLSFEMKPLPVTKKGLEDLKYRMGRPNCRVCGKPRDDMKYKMCSGCREAAREKARRKKEQRNEAERNDAGKHGRGRRPDCD